MIRGQVPNRLELMLGPTIDNHDQVLFQTTSILS